MFAVEKINEIKQDVLYAVKYTKCLHCCEGYQDEFQRLLDCWFDTLYLYDFFKQNQSLIEKSFYDCTIEEAVNRTINDAQNLEKKLSDLKPEEVLDFFKPLHRINYDKNYDQMKAYGTLSKSWLRLYGIKVDDEIIVITGGGIKLTRRMDDIFLAQLKQVKDWLIAKTIIDKDSLIDYINLEI